MTDDDSRTLKQLQQWLHSVITEPQGVRAGIESAGGRIGSSLEDIESLVPSSGKLDAVSKIEVYGNAYFARLVECLGDEFPAVKAALEEDGFNSFAFSYLQQYPSRSYTLAELGKNFPKFLTETKPEDAGELGWADFLIDLARLEWHYSEIFNGPGTEKSAPLAPDDLRRLTPEEFASSRLIPAPCLRLDMFWFPVHEYATAVRKRQESPSFPPPQPTWLVMTRRNYVVRRVAVPEAEYAVLHEFWNSSDEPVSAILERTAETWADEMQSSLQTWFERWTAAGYFVAVEAC
jgi:hypothetical protein